MKSGLDDYFSCSRQRRINWIQISAGSTEGMGVGAAGRQVFLDGHICIDLTVQISCFVTIYIIIWANTTLNLIHVFRYLWYAIFKE